MFSTKTLIQGSLVAGEIINRTLVLTDIKRGYGSAPIEPLKYSIGELRTLISELEKIKDKMENA